MNCLCCGKPLQADADTGWHKGCIRHFFGTAQLPEIEIDDRTLELLADESIHKGYTVPGVQKKLSLHLLSDPKHPRLTLVNFPTGYILKPPVERFAALPEAEQLVMHMADAVGIATVPHGLLQKNGRYAYITKRVDRIFGKTTVEMLAMEDFCQLDFRLTQDKYKGSYERCAKLLLQHSCRAGLDTTELFMRLLFCFLVGNSDMHLKNFSLLETAPAGGQYALSPAYDLLPVNVILPEDTEQFALTLHGKKRNLRRHDFLSFADSCGISAASAVKMIERLLSQKQRLLAMCGDSLLPPPMQASLCALLEERCRALA